MRIAPTDAEHLADRPGELDSGNVECLLDALGVTVDLAHELLAGARELTQGPDFRRGYEAAPDEPMGVKVDHPRGIVDVALVTGQVLDVSRIGQRQLEPALQYVPHGLPVASRCFHDHVGHPFAL